MLAQLLDWHGRDAKPEWWNYFRLQKLSVDGLIESSEGIGGLTFEADLEERGRGGFVRRYRFTPQDHKIRVGRPAFDPADGENGKDAGEVVAVDDIEGTVDLFRTALFQE